MHWKVLWSEQNWIYNYSLQFTDLPLLKNQTFYLFSCDKKTKQDSDHDLIADINRNGKQQQNNPIKQLGLEIRVKKKKPSKKIQKKRQSWK